MAKQKYSVVMTDEWKELCDEYCKEFGISFSAMVREGIDLFLQQQIYTRMDIPHELRWKRKLFLVKEAENQAERAAK